MSDSHPFERIFEEFGDLSAPTPTKILIGKMITRTRKARLKGGSGETLTFYEMSDGLAILEIAPPGVESPTDVKNVIQKFFHIPKTGAMEYKPSTEQGEIIQRMGQRISELCPPPDQGQERVAELLRNAATLKVAKDKN